MPTQFRRPSAALRVFRFTPVALAAVLASQPALSATRNWTGGAGAANSFWDLAANWNTGVPLGGDVASLGNKDTNIRTGTWALQSMSGTGTLSMTAGELALTAASSTGDLILSGGVLGSKGALTTGTFVWNGNYLGSSAALGGDLNVTGASTLNNAAKYVNFGQALNMKGNSSWVDNGYLYLYGAGIFNGTAYGESTVNVFAGKTLTLQGNAASYYQITGSGGTFNNAGTLTKTGSNALYIDSNFNNTGTLNINGGETLFRYMRTLGGTINVAAGATANFNGQTTLAPTVSIGGAGNLIFSGSYTLLNSGTRTFGGAGTKTLSAGYLGGGGTMVFNKLAWTGGYMGFYDSVGGVTTVNGPATFGATSLQVNYGRTLNLNGDTTWAGNGILYIYGAGVYNGVAYNQSVINLAAGTEFEMQGNAASYFQLYSGGTFNNAGTVTKTGINTLYIDSQFNNNAGILNANGGEVRFGGERTLGGTINTASGATLNFNGSTTFAPSVKILGDGNLIFGGSYNVLPSGSRTFGGSGTKSLDGGYLGGAGTMVFNKLAWNNGYMGFYNAVGGVTTVTGMTTLSPNAHYVYYGRTLNLNGGANWAGNGVLYVEGAGTYNGVAYGPSVLNLAAGKVLNMAGNAASYYQFYGAGTVNNSGTINKNGINTLYVDSNFNNTGTLNINGGLTRFSGARTLGGTVNVASGATLQLYGSTTIAPSAVIAGDGDYIFGGSTNIVASGTRTFGGTGNKTLEGGYLGGGGTTVFNKLAWTGGTMGYYDAVGGTTTVNGNSTLNSNAHYLYYGRTLNLNGTTNWIDGGYFVIDTSGTYNGVAYGESVLNVPAGKAFNLQGNAASFYQVYGGGTFNNAGTLTKTGSNILYLDAKTNNTGTLSANAGAVQIRGVFNNTGTLHANGARIDFTAATFLPQFTAASQTLTAGTYRVTGSEPLALKLGNVSGSTAAIIKVNKAKIYLKNAGATVLTTTPTTPINALTKLATNQGVLSLTTGATLTTTVALKNTVNGNLTVGSGSSMTIGGAGLTQTDAGSSTYVGGTLTAKTMSFSGGSFSAGNASGLIGSGTLLAAVGGVNFSAASTFGQDVASAASWDKIAVNAGNLIVDGTLDATFAAGVNVGTYRFLTTTTGTRFGIFDTIVSNLDAGLYTVSAVYGTKFVDLKVVAVPAGAPGAELSAMAGRTMVAAVPEPGTYAMFAAGLALLGWHARRVAAARKV